MAPANDTQQTLRRADILCRDILINKLWSGAAYGARANIYRPSDIADLELNSPQYLLLALLYSLVTGDIMSCVVLAAICQRVEKLRSRHYKVWLLEDFDFPRPDIQKVMALIVQLLADGILKLPPHVLGIMASLAKKYGFTDVQLRTLSEEGGRDLATQLENSVVNNNVRDIFDLASEGADVCGLTQSGDSLLHLAARAGNSVSIGVLGFLMADLEAVNSNNATPLEEAVRNNSAPSVKALLRTGAKIDRRLSDGNTYLHIAAEGGQNEALGALLDGRMEINQKNDLGETPIMIAIAADNFVGFKKLLEKGADSSVLQNMRLENGESIFHSLARSGNNEILKILKDRKLHANIKNQKGLTPLHVASEVSIARMVLSMDVNVDTQDNDGRTALMYAAKNSKEDVVSMLLFNRASTKIKDKQGRTPLHYAAEGGCIGCVTTLVIAGAGVDEMDNDGDTPAIVAAVNRKLNVMQLLLERGADLNLKDGNGAGILHLKARSGNVEVVTALLQAGVAVDSRGQNQWTALHEASSNGHLAVVKLLIDRGADLEAKTVDGHTPLTSASCNGHLPVVQLLIDRGADLAAKTTQGSTPLTLASSKGHLAVVQLLINRGADLAAKTVNGHTPLILASSKGHLAVVQLLIDRGADLEAKTVNGHTPLILASRDGHLAVVQLLIDRGADLEAKLVDGHTPLTAASCNGHLAVVQLLVDRGSPLNEVGNGRTALGWANYKNHTAIADYLRSKGAV